MSRSTGSKIAELEKRLAADPESHLFLPLAEAYRAAGRPGESERLLRDGLVCHPDHHAARASLGRVLFEAGRAEEALLVLEQVRVADPDNLLARRLLEELGAGVLDGDPREIPQAGEASPGSAEASPGSAEGRGPSRVRPPTSSAA